MDEHGGYAYTVILLLVVAPSELLLHHNSLVLEHFLLLLISLQFLDFFLLLFDPDGQGRWWCCLSSLARCTDIEACSAGGHCSVCARRCVVFVEVCYACGVGSHD